MKKELLALFALLSLVSCGNTSQRRTVADVPQADRVEVLAFHGRQRCATCRAVEELTREVVEADFAQQLAAGEVVLRIVDIEEPDSEALADRYEVAWSSLILTKWQDGKQTVNDLTSFAFANARSNPEGFKAELSSEIEKLLAR